MKPMLTTGTQTRNLFFYISILSICIIIISSSCSTTKRISYFKDIPDTVFLAARNIQTTTFTDPVVQPNDILQVSILTLDPQTNSVLSSTNTASFTVQPANGSAPAGTAAIAG